MIQFLLHVLMVIIPVLGLALILWRMFWGGRPTKAERASQDFADRLAHQGWSPVDFRTNRF